MSRLARKKVFGDGWCLLEHGTLDMEQILVGNISKTAGLCFRGLELGRAHVRFWYVL